MSSTDEKDTEGLYTYDIEKKQIKTLAFRHAKAGVGSLIFSGKARALVGVRYDTERPEIYWFDAARRRIQAAVDAALTNTVNKPVSATLDESKTVFLAFNDRTPGTYYLTDTVRMKLQRLFDQAEWIHPEEMSEMKPIEYRARDGLQIHGYLTVPKEAAGTRVPLVVMPHGGPTLRDRWGFDPEVQFLANRGYAVLQVNFRGSTGYGAKFLEAGFKQWGLKQQDDITDGVRWAIDQGAVDPGRIAIFGGSYGGYAALTGLEKTPELYRCGICYAGVTDLLRTLDATPDVKIVRAFLAETVGDLKKEKDRLDAASPVNYVDKIQVPVLMAYGELDPLVPIATGRAMAKALKKRGKLYDFIVKDDEGHGFHKESNRIEFWKKVDEFLKANLQEQGTSGRQQTAPLDFEDRCCERRPR